ncbi:MAG: carboxypeptidase-like regulatory domain-containing protein, partial [Terracidiphilus sp.]
MFGYFHEPFRQLRKFPPGRLISARKGVFLIIGLFLAISLQAVGQFDSASVLGTLRDHSGAVLNNGTVVLTNRATGTQQTMLSNKNGNFEFGSVKPGDYMLSAE